METLSDKIVKLEERVIDNNAIVTALKEKLAEETKIISAENRKLNAIIKKLKQTEATIAGIFGEAEEVED